MMLRSPSLEVEHICGPPATLFLSLKPILYQHLSDRRSHPQLQNCWNGFAKLNVTASYSILIYHELLAYLAPL